MSDGLLLRAVFGEQVTGESGDVCEGDGVEKKNICGCKVERD